MDLQFADKLRAALATGRPFAMVTIVGTGGSSPQKPGAKMIVFKDGSIEGTVGGGAIEHRIIKDTLAAFAEGEAKLVRYDLKDDAGMICGGEMTAYIEPSGVGEPVAIFGCGHVCRALAPALARVGFRVTVVDDRSEWADEAGFPPGVHVVCKGFDEYLSSLDEGLDELYVVVVTRGHKFDYGILRHFVDRNVRYLGVMASRKKAREFLTRLEEEGVARALAEAVHMPVGLDIGSVTPEEIAVSIAGELIAVRRKAGDGA